MDEERVINSVIQQIKTNINNELQSENNLRITIRKILRNTNLKYQDSKDNNVMNEELNNITTKEVIDCDNKPHKIDLNLMVGKAIADYYHMILVQFNMFLEDSNIFMINNQNAQEKITNLSQEDLLDSPPKLFKKIKNTPENKKMTLSFEEPHHLFGLPMITMERGNLSYPDNEIKSILESLKSRKNSNIKDLQLQYYDLSIPYRLLIEKNNINNNFIVFVNECIKAAETEEEFWESFTDSEYREVFIPILNTLSDNYKTDYSIVEKYLQVIINDCFDKKKNNVHNSSITFKDIKEDIINKINEKDLDLLKKSRDLLYLKGEEFAQNIWTLICFFKSTQKDEYWFDQIKNSIKNKDKEVFKKIIYNFYKQYSLYFQVNNYSYKDIEAELQTIYDDLNKKDENNVIYNYYRIINRQKNDQKFNNDLFVKLDNYTKRVLYTDYELYTNNTMDNAYIFDLLLHNGIYIYYDEQNKRNYIPNYIKIYNKLNTIQSLLNLIQEHFLKASTEEGSISYEMIPIKVNMWNVENSTNCYNIKINKHLILRIMVNGNNYKVVSIRDGSNNTEKKSSIKLIAASKGGRTR